MIKKRISVQTAIMVAALMALSGYALALTVTQTRTSYEAISGGQILVTDSIQVSFYGLKNIVGSGVSAVGTTRADAVSFTAGGADCANGLAAAPRDVTDGDFVLVFDLFAQPNAPANTVFQVYLVATGEVPGTVFVVTGNAPVAGTCVSVIFGLGSSFVTPFTYRMEVRVAP